MDNYVTLTLDKYNELYNKANCYDNYISNLSQKVGEVVSNVIDTFKDEEKEQKYEFNVGDRIKVKKLKDGYGTVSRIDFVNKLVFIEFSKNTSYLDAEYSFNEIEKVDESEDK